MCEGKDESACMRGKSRSTVPLSIKLWRGGGKQLQWHLHDVPLSCSANSFRDYRMCPHHSSRSGFPPAWRMDANVLTGGNLRDGSLTGPLPRNPRPDYPPPVSTSFPRWNLIPNSFSPSLRLLQLYPSHGRTDKRGASSSIDGNDALILPCLPLPRAPHRIVNVATRLRRGRPNICLFRRPWRNPSLL